MSEYSSSSKDSTDWMYIPGWDKVDNSAEHLVSLHGLAMTERQVNETISLFDDIGPFDKGHQTFPPRHQARQLTERFKVNKKKSAVAPGIDGTRRSFLGPGVPALKPPPLGPSDTDLQQGLYPLGTRVLDLQIPVIQPSDSNLAMSSHAKSTMWYRNKMETIAKERLEKGEPPIKKYKRVKDYISCKLCGQPRRKETGHSQVKGRWWCPRSFLSLAEWKMNLQK